MFDEGKTADGNHLGEEAEGNSQEQISNIDLGELLILALVHAKRKNNRSIGSGPSSEDAYNKAVANG